MMKQKQKGINSVRVLLILFFTVAVVIPLVGILSNLATADIGKILTSPATRDSLKRSLFSSLTATVISVFTASAAAWCMTRSKIPLKPIFNLLLLLPMLIPSISHGMGLVILFGSNGKLTNFFGMTQGLYGFWGIVIGSVLYSFPVAYLMIYDVLRYEDSTPYEAASVLGIGKFRRLTAITLPYLRKPMLNVLFATFTLIVTDYGVPIMVGGRYKTLPVLMYEEVIGRLDYGKGSVFGVILLIPALLAFAVDLFCSDNKKSSFVTHPFELAKNTVRDVLSFVITSAVALCTVYPVFSFVQLTFAKRYPRDMGFTLEHIKLTAERGAFTYLLNSVMTALFVALIGMAVSFICAYVTSRYSGKASRLIHLMSVTSLAVPGLVLGLSYVIVFKGTFIYGTFAILILVNIIHFFSSPYLMMKNSLGKINANLESVGQTLGISRVRMVLDVIVPQTRKTLVQMFSYFFVNSMMTISAVAFLARNTTKPISLMITQFEAQTQLEAAAFVSLMILCVNLLMKLAVYIADRRVDKRKVGVTN